MKTKKRYSVKILFLIFSLTIILSCNPTRKEVDKAISIVPYPKSIKVYEGKFKLDKNTTIDITSDDILPVAKVFAENIFKLTGDKIQVNTGNPKKASIILKINPALSKSQYQIDVNKSVLIEAGEVKSLINAAYTFLQLIEEKEGQFEVPLVQIEDTPDFEYRGLLIDLARNWHDVSNVKQLIDLAAFYKLNYLQLHFTDYQSYTLPSKHYPKLSTEGRHYSFDELRHLVEYSKLRGISIIPEIDIPGHSKAMIDAYPGLFGIKDIKENPYCINMGKEEVYIALEKLINEMIDIFDSSPYFHIGGDEAIFHMLDKDPDIQSYMKKHGLGTDIHELYRHFIVRINEIVKKRGKQLCVWEGFRPEGKIQIPKDIIVFEFETNRYLPCQLIKDGYTVVNTSWKPLYVVNEKKWSPEYIYGWNMWRWENWFDKAPSFVPIQCEESPKVIGGQMCSWEQAQELEFPSLRKRVAAFSEKVWTAKTAREVSEFIDCLNQTDNSLTILVNDARQDTLPAFKN